MTDDTQAPRPAAPGPLATAGLPDEVFEPSTTGDLLSLTTLRAHIHRCAACRAGASCDTRPILVKIYNDALDVLKRAGR